MDLYEKINLKRAELDRSLNIDDKLRIRKELSILLQKKEVLNNRLAGKFKVYKNQVQEVKML